MKKIFVLVFFLFSFIFFIVTEDQETRPKPNLKLAFVGDLMLDRGVKNSVYKNFAGDYSQLFIKVKSQLQNYDLLFGNLEGPVSDQGEDQGGAYSFRMEPKVISVLRDSGFDVFSVANNHIFNWGQVAFTDTLQSLAEAGLTYVGGGFGGSEAYSAQIINVSGVKMAFLGFSEFSAGDGIAVISEENIKNSVAEARAKSDLVIVSFHFGEEYQKLPNDYQKKYAELAIDSGADLIIGHHPHVVETLEQYRNAYIIYSLGNFIFDQYFSPETMSGGLLEVEIDPNLKKVQAVNLKTVKLNKFFQIESISL